MSFVGRIDIINSKSGTYLYITRLRPRLIFLRTEKDEDSQGMECNIGREIVKLKQQLSLLDGLATNHRKTVLKIIDDVSETR